MTEYSLEALNSCSSVEEQSVNDAILEIKPHHRILHFSDGTMEEESSSSDTDQDIYEDQLDFKINENEVAFITRLQHKAYRIGNNLLSAIDYAGGSLAWVFGIISPKYIDKSSSTDHYIAPLEGDATQTCGLVTSQPRLSNSEGN